MDQFQARAHHRLAFRYQHQDQGVIRAVKVPTEQKTRDVPFQVRQKGQGQGQRKGKGKGQGQELCEQAARGHHCERDGRPGIDTVPLHRQALGRAVDIV